MTTVAAAAGARQAIARQQATEINKKYHAQIAEQRAKERAYEAALRMEAYEQEQQRKRNMKAWFDKYDSDASGVLEVAELRDLLHELYPEEPSPSEELCETLIAMCVGAENTRHGIRLDEVIATSTRFHDYIKRKAEIDRAFKKIDVDGNGFIDEDELRVVMSNVSRSSHALVDADLAFVYDACGVKRNAPIPPAMLPALMPALAEWAKLSAVAGRSAVVEGRPQPSRGTKTGSGFCLVM